MNFFWNLEMTMSHSEKSWLCLCVFVFLAAERRHHFAGTKLYCLLTALGKCMNSIICACENSTLTITGCFPCSEHGKQIGKIKKKCSSCISSSSSSSSHVGYELWYMYYWHKGMLFHCYYIYVTRLVGSRWWSVFICWQSTCHSVYWRRSVT